MQYQAVVFDLDGTLLDTLDDLADSVNHALAAQGFPVHPVEAYRYFIGDGATEMIERTVPEEARTDAAVQTTLELFREEYSQNWRVKTNVYDGVPQMLDNLARLQVRTAILSNKPHESTVQCARELLAPWSFDLVLGQRDGVPKKPHPAGALEAADRMGMQPAQCLYLGDTAVDMRTALAAGMLPVGALWGFRTAEELRNSGARKLLAHPRELAALLQ